jgi:hypothetical protein
MDQSGLAFPHPAAFTQRTAWGCVRYDNFACHFDPEHVIVSKHQY